MHELGITQSIVDTCRAAAGSAPVKRVTVEIGCLCGVMPDAVRFCFDVCAQGTALEGSLLHIVSIPGRGVCRDCGMELVLEDFLALCACGSANLAVSGGDELRVKDMEIG